MEQGSKKLDQPPPPHPEAATMPLPCANNCGFFGSPATNNLCSKCFRDHLRRGLAAASTSGDAGPTPAREEQAAPAPSAPVVGGGSRCAHCRKKVGLMGFECRCGEVFCGAHRYADEHECGYDYKAAGQDAIARANPVVKADKVDKL